jgi:GNAT superfamily N-acetyltransferase
VTVSVRALEESDVGPVVEFSVRAWKPVFESMCRVMGPEIFRRVYPNWSAGQAQAVESVCRADGNRVWVAGEDGRPVGFVAVVLHDQDCLRSGEIEMVAVDSGCQSRGIGLTLVSLAVEEIGKLGRQEFAAMSRNAPASSLDAFRADQDATADHEDGDPYDR